MKIIIISSNINIYFFESGEILDSNEIKRIDKNALLFTLSFGVMGGIFGLINDAFRSYVRIVNPDISKNFTIYIGIAMIILTLVIISINKFGFKKILIFLELLIMVAFITSITVPNSYILPLDIIALQLGYKSFNFIIILVMVSYSSRGNRIFRFARALLLYVFIEAIVSMFDGKLVVYIFKNFLNITYKQANLLSKNIDKFSSFQLHSYLTSYKIVIILGVFLTILSLSFLLFIREKESDFRDPVQFNNWKERINAYIDFRIFKDKYIIIWIVYSTLMSLDSTLIAPNLAVYLGNYLHIERGTVSTLISAKSFGEVLLLLITPFLVKKLGAIKAFSLLLLFSAPLMLLLTFSTSLGSSMIMLVGVALFFRYGFTMATHPIQNSLELLLVKKNLRAFLVASTAALDGIISSFVGLYGKKLFFYSVSGYQSLFMIFTVVFVISSALVYFGYRKRFRTL